MSPPESFSVSKRSIGSVLHCFYTQLNVVGILVPTLYFSSNTFVAFTFGIFTSRFSALGLLNAMKAHTVAFRSLMCYEEVKTTADTLEQLFEPITSQNGSSKRATEDKVYAWWLDLIQFVDGYYCQSHTVFTLPIVN